MGKVILANGNGAEKRSIHGPSMNQVVLCGRLVADPRGHRSPGSRQSGRTARQRVPDGDQR